MVFAAITSLKESHATITSLKEYNASGGAWLKCKQGGAGQFSFGDLQNPNLLWSMSLLTFTQPGPVCAAYTWPSNPMAPTFNNTFIASFARSRIFSHLMCIPKTDSNTDWLTVTVCLLRVWLTHIRVAQTIHAHPKRLLSSHCQLELPTVADIWVYL